MERKHKVNWLIWILCAPVMLLLGVTPEVGNARFTGLVSKSSYNVAFYISDVDNITVKWATGGAPPDANALPYVTFPEPVTLNDVAIPTGNTVATRLMISRGGQPVLGGDLMIANQLNTLANRIGINIGFLANQMISFLQKAV
jgi:hypothetical protein